MRPERAPEYQNDRRKQYANEAEDAIAEIERGESQQRVKPEIFADYLRLDELSDNEDYYI